MPDREAVLGQHAAHHRPRRRRQHRPDHQVGRDADRQAGQHQQQDGRAHPAWRLLGRTRQVGRRRAEEDVVAEAQRVDDGEQRGHRRQHRQRPAGPDAAGDEHRLGEEHLLGQEAVEQRHAGHRRGGHQRQRAGARHGADQAVEPADVARAGLVVDHARGHEQRGLEGRVVHGVEHAGHRRQRAVEAQQQGDQAEVADRRIGQQGLEVVLEHGEVGADQQRHRAGAAHQPEPPVGAGQHRPEARQHEDARLHHRRRVQVGRDRRRRGHRPRQPEVERELRALGERADQDQHQRGRIPGMRLDLRARGEHRVEVVAADDPPQQHHAAQQAQPARAGDHQRHARAALGVHAVVPVADQQEGDEAGHLPEHHQLQQVARQHHAQHRAHEGEEHRVEARHRVVRRHVIARVQADQHADHGDQHREHPGEAVHAQHQVQPERRHPGQHLADHPALAHLREQAEHPDRRGQRDRAGGARLQGARPRRQRQRDQAAEEGQEQQQEEAHGDGPV